MLINKKTTTITISNELIAKYILNNEDSQIEDEKTSISSRSIALQLELEKTSPCMLNFGYLNPATYCLLDDVNNNIVVMF